MKDIVNTLIFAVASIIITLISYYRTFIFLLFLFG